MKCIIFLLIQISAFTSQASLLPESLDASGSLTTGYWQNNRKFSEDENFSVNSVWLKMKPIKNDINIYFEALLYNEDSFRSSTSYGEIKEFYISKEVGRFDIRIGRQTILWGRGDKINPTDNLTIKDQTKLFARDEAQVSGVGSLYISYLINEEDRLIFIWQPEWRESNYLLNPVENYQFVDSEPQSNEKQYAIKYEHTGSGFDGSISWFDGYDKLGDFKLLDVMNGIQRVQLVHIRKKVLGLDGATTYSGYNIRGEIAYSEFSSRQDTDEINKKSNWYGVVGFDFNTNSSWNINLQLLARHVVGYRDPVDENRADLQQIATTAAIYHSQDKMNTIAEVLRISKKWLNDSLESEVVLVGWFSETYFLRPQLTYAYSDEVTATVGGEIYGGDDNTYFGRLKDLSTAYLELRYNF